MHAVTLPKLFSLISEHQVLRRVPITAKVDQTVRLELSIDQ